MALIEKQILRLLRAFVPEGRSLAFAPSSSEPLAAALAPDRCTDLRAISELSDERPDFVLLHSWLNSVDDVHAELSHLRGKLAPHSRVIVLTYNRLWQYLGVARTKVQRETSPLNWLPPGEIANLLEQADYEVVSTRRAVFPPIPLLGRFLGRWLSDIPVLRHFSMIHVTTARPLLRGRRVPESVSVIVAARNEEGNLNSLMERLPRLATRQELIFVEGGSTDATWERLNELVTHGTSTPWLTVQVFKQEGTGKGDAVRLGMSKATGEILVILDADLSVPPEELPRFIEVLSSDMCEFANGSRLVYPMEKRAMQFLNQVANRLFGATFTGLLGQSVRDTLCGTKALWADDYRQIDAQRGYFGDFDPFGDFDLLFGAARLSLRIRDVPIHYKERTYGSTNISRFRHGVLLIRMTMVAARRLRTA
jgi:hypothetical protein